MSDNFKEQLEGQCAYNKVCMRPSERRGCQGYEDVESFSPKTIWTLFKCDGKPDGNFEQGSVISDICFKNRTG